MPVQVVALNGCSCPWNSKHCWHVCACVCTISCLQNCIKNLLRPMPWAFLSCNRLCKLSSCRALKLRPLTWGRESWASWRRSGKFRNLQHNLCLQSRLSELSDLWSLLSAQNQTLVWSFWASRIRIPRAPLPQGTSLPRARQPWADFLTLVQRATGSLRAGRWRERFQKRAMRWRTEQRKTRPSPLKLKSLTSHWTAWRWCLRRVMRMLRPSAGSTNSQSR